MIQDFHEYRYKKREKDSDLFFNLAKSFNEVSSVASVYAKIMVLMDT